MGCRVNVSDEMKTCLLIKDIRPQMTHFNLHSIVLQVAPGSYKTKEGNQVRTCRIADKSGSINLSVWGDYCNLVQAGDILLLTKCYSVVFKNHLTVYIGKAGLMRKMGEFCFIFNETPDLSEPNPEWIHQQHQREIKKESGAIQQCKVPGNKFQPIRIKRDKDGP